jgi:hypothetical protein
VLRVLFSVLGFIALTVVWFWIVTATGMWWALRYAQPPAGSDTYFLTSSWIYRSLVILPLVLFSLWYWRRVVRRAA